jgi:hypothetical protein
MPLSINDIGEGLALGSTNPGSILVAQETLDFRRAGLSPAFLLLMPAFLLPYTPPRLTPTASARMEHSSTSSVRRTLNSIIRKSKCHSVSSRCYIVRFWHLLEICKANFQDIELIVLHTEIRSFGTTFKPRTFSALKLLTSELLRFL